MRNQLLSTLRRSDLDLLRADLDHVRLAPQQPLQLNGHVPEEVYFPCSGLVSVLATCGARSMEAALVGREGLVGATALLGQGQMRHTAVVLVPGEAWRIPVGALQRACAASPELYASLLQQVHNVIAQVTQTVFATGRCNVEQRIARWLAMAHDRLEQDEISLTHECLAHVLGVRRPGVTVALHVLEGEHAIRSLRGRIVIRDRARLEQLAGPAYQRPAAPAPSLPQLAVAA